MGSQPTEFAVRIRRDPGTGKEYERFTFNRFTGEVVTFGQGTMRYGGDWREPSTAQESRVTFPVPTGRYVDEPVVTCIWCRKPVAFSSPRCNFREAHGA